MRHAAGEQLRRVAGACVVPHGRRIQPAVPVAELHRVGPVGGDDIPRAVRQRTHELPHRLTGDGDLAVERAAATQLHRVRAVAIDRVAKVRAAVVGGVLLAPHLVHEPLVVEPPRRSDVGVAEAREHPDLCEVAGVHDGELAPAIHVAHPHCQHLAVRRQDGLVHVLERHVIGRGNRRHRVFRLGGSALQATNRNHAACRCHPDRFHVPSASPTAFIAWSVRLPSGSPFCPSAVA